MESSEVLFHLLRIAIGKSQSSVCEDLQNDLCTDTNWQEVYSLALRQGVLGVTWSDEFSQNALRWGVDEDLKYSWLGQLLAQERSCVLYKRTLADLTRFYRFHGLKMLLLKGYGLSLNYPIPDRRPFGDIDIFLMDETHSKHSWKLGDTLIQEKLGISVDDSHEHHTTFNVNGFTVENHYDFINTKGTRSAKFIEKVLKDLSTKNVYTEKVNDVDVYLPSPDFNAIFLMRHMGQHFAGERISLRHLLDWGVFVDKYTADINWDFVVPYWEKIGIGQFARCINSICVEKLSISEEKFQGVLSGNSQLSQRVLADILSPEFTGNKPNESVLKVTAFKTRRFFSNGWKRRMVYKESLLENFITGSIAHLRRYKTIKD